MADQGDQESIQMDSMDQAAMEQAQSTESLGEAMNGIPVIGNSGMGDGMVQRANAEMAEVQRRADMKTQLAEASSAGSTMRVDPDQVDKLATFFQGKAEELMGRQMDLELLADVQPPGGDPVSNGAARVYSEVGGGNDRAYLENYEKLIKIFENAAANLKGSAQQVRSDDQGAEDGLRA